MTVRYPPHGRIPPPSPAPAAVPEHAARCPDCEYSPRWGALLRPCDAHKCPSCEHYKHDDESCDQGCACFGGPAVTLW